MVELSVGPLYDEIHQHLGFGGFAQCIGVSFTHELY
jgi:hypothetical protein